MEKITQRRNGIERRSQILAFITKFQGENGYSPNIREIGAAVGLTSTSSTWHHLEQLMKLGEIERDIYKPRNVTMTRSVFPTVPDDA